MGLRAFVPSREKNPLSYFPPDVTASPRIVVGLFDNLMIASRLPRGRACWVRALVCLVMIMNKPVLSLSKGLS